LAGSSDTGVTSSADKGRAVLLAAVGNQHHGADHKNQRDDVPDIGLERLPQGRLLKSLACHGPALAGHCVANGRKGGDRTVIGVIGEICDEMTLQGRRSE